MRDPVPLKLKPKPLDSFEDARPRWELALAASRRSRTFNNWASNLYRVSGCDSCGISKMRQVAKRKRTDEFRLSAFLGYREATPLEQ